MARIYVDIGHGGKDPGAVATTNGYKYVEHKFNVRIGNQFAERLRKLGHTVVVEPGNLEIAASAAKANASGAEYLFSFHINAGGGNRGEIYYSKESGAKELADAMAEAMKEFGQSEVRVIYKPNSSGTAEYMGILRGSKMPGVLLEPCFLDHKEDVKLLDTANEQLDFADLLAIRFDQFLRCRACRK